MKWGIYILKGSVIFLIITPLLYLSLYCFGDGFDPIEIETILTFVFAALGIGLSLLLIRFSVRIPAFLFWIFFILFLLTFTFPAIVSSVFLLLFI